ncbi:MAG: hypothetical protein FIB08_15780 [Candidatus Methanoperedens sp.]|nr:hypothetical protein [Candidatus Methanoperedens sp.]
MKFAEKCPKCNGNVQTKIIKKSIGLGFVDIPVAQFCLNPACDWYQDFSEQKNPGDIKEDILQVKIPSVKKSRKFSIALGGFIFIIAISLIFNSLIQPNLQSQKNVGKLPDTLNTSGANITPAVRAEHNQPSAATGVKESKKYSIKIDVAHGFNPAAMTINTSDIIVWNNEENQRTRIALISKDSLFKNKILAYSDKYQYQFNMSGSFVFVLAEYDQFNHTYNEYPKSGEIIVR